MQQLDLRRELAARLPDVPRWVEARALLLSGRGELFGLDEEGASGWATSSPAAPSFVVRHPLSGDAVVVGTPPVEAIRAAAAFDGPGRSIVAPLEQRPLLEAALPGWTAGRAVLHVLGDASRLPGVAPGAVRLLEPAGPAGVDALVAAGATIPAGLLRELRIGAETSPVAAAFAGARPVSFCYAGAVTETLWDVSIDTLEADRRQGHAARCVAYMIRLLWAEERQPVWGAAEDNPASWRLAGTLGFLPADELALLKAPEA
jgi:hypothetical protein